MAQAAEYPGFETCLDENCSPTKESEVNSYRHGFKVEE